MADADTAPNTTKSMDDIVALCRRRGFIWQSSEIYGGINGFWDYGPLGARLKRNLKDAWWHDIVDCPPDGPDGKPLHIVPVDTTIIGHPKTWHASGHLAGFSDPMVDDKETKQRFRADHLMGFYAAYEGDSASASFLDRQAEPHITTMPDVTTVASTPGEATRQLIHDRKLQKLFGIRSIAFASGMVPDSEQAEAELAAGSIDFVDIDFGNGAILHFVQAVPQESLRRYPAKVLSPFTGKAGALTEPREFNLMFETYVGAVRDEDAKAYLRPETAQGIFTQFWNVVDTSRVKVPFGIAQQGKAFRNEVTPRNFTFRSREFEQMEIEFFIRPDEHCEGDEARALDWYRYWRDLRYAWWQSVGLAGDNLTLREHDADELAHYAKEGAGTSDVEYRFPFTSPGFGELEGIAHRSNYDLRQHAEHSGYGDKKRYFDQERNARYFPHVIEPSAGADRGTLALLCEAYTVDESRPSKEFMKFAPRMAPIKAGIFPLVNKDGMPEVAAELYRRLRRRWTCEMDAKQSIGKRYARMDEAGTPYCFTIDGDTLKDQTVTVRDRDTASQQRISLDQVEAFLTEKLGE